MPKMMKAVTQKEQEEREKRIKTKYATITFKYKEDDSGNNNMGNALHLIQTIANAISDYNAKDAVYGYSRFELVGFYVDPDEMDVDEQNETLKEFKEEIV